jgi:hypothetical protein
VRSDDFSSWALWICNLGPLVSGSTVLSIFQCRLARHFEARRLLVSIHSAFAVPFYLKWRIFWAFEHFPWAEPRNQAECPRARTAVPRSGLKNCLDLWGTSVNNAVLSVGAIYLQNVLWWSNVGGFQTLMFKNFVSKCVNVPPNCRDISICSE